MMESCLTREELLSNLNNGGVKMELLATGNTAQVYDLGDGTICKLFNSGYSHTAVLREIRNAEIMNGTSLKTPKYIRLMQMDRRDGIVYSKIIGTDLLIEAQACMDEEGILRILQDMTALQKQLQRHESTECISYKEFLRWHGCDNLNALRDGNTLCHGDFHPGNIIREKDGPLVLLDFMNVCHGPKEYDIARTYALLTDGLPDEELRAFVGGTYLQLMDISFKEIEPYLAAVHFCRQQEMANEGNVSPVGSERNGSPVGCPLKAEVTRTSQSKQAAG